MAVKIDMQETVPPHVAIAAGLGGKAILLINGEFRAGTTRILNTLQCECRYSRALDKQDATYFSCVNRSNSTLRRSQDQFLAACHDGGPMDIAAVILKSGGNRRNPGPINPRQTLNGERSVA